MIIMQLWGSANGIPTPFDGQYLADFDFEAADGQGEIVMTANPKQAKQFPDMLSAMTFWRTSPKCKPTRADGRPNRPLTSTNWEFQTLESSVPSTERK